MAHLAVCHSILRFPAIIAPCFLILNVIHVSVSCGPTTYGMCLLAVISHCASVLQAAKDILTEKWKSGKNKWFYACAFSCQKCPIPSLILFGALLVLENLANHTSQSVFLLFDLLQSVLA